MLDDSVQRLEVFVTEGIKLCLDQFPLLTYSLLCERSIAYTEINQRTMRKSQLPC